MDSLFKPEDLASIASLVGVQLNEDGERAQDITEDEKVAMEESKEVTSSSLTRYNIRKGREDDVLKDKRKLNEPIKATSSCISEYSFEDFQKEFMDEKTNEDLYEDDSRVVAEYEMQDGGTYEAGRVLDKEYVVVREFLIYYSYKLHHVCTRNMKSSFI